MNQAIPVAREKRLWWAVADNTVRFVTGYSCMSDDSQYGRSMWWCPEMGYTLTEGRSLFETEKEALWAGIRDAAKQIAAITRMLENLQERLAKLP